MCTGSVGQRSTVDFNISADKPYPRHRFLMQNEWAVQGPLGLRGFEAFVQKLGASTISCIEFRED